MKLPKQIKKAIREYSLDVQKISNVYNDNTIDYLGDVHFWNIDWEFGSFQFKNIYGNVKISCVGIDNLDFFSKLEYVQGDIIFLDTYLKNLKGLENLRCVGGSLIVDIADRFTSLDGISEHLKPFVKIYNCKNLMSVENMEKLKTYNEFIAESSSRSITDKDNYARTTIPYNIGRAKYINFRDVVIEDLKLDFPIQIVASCHSTYTYMERKIKTKEYSEFRDKRIVDEYREELEDSVFDVYEKNKPLQKVINDFVNTEEYNKPYTIKTEKQMYSMLEPYIDKSDKELHKYINDNGIKKLLIRVIGDFMILTTPIHSVDMNMDDFIFLYIDSYWVWNFKLDTSDNMYLIDILKESNNSDIDFDDVYILDIPKS